MANTEKSNNVARRRGPQKLYTEKLLVTLQARTIAAIDKARTPDETRLALIRSAIEAELTRRQT